MILDIRCLKWVSRAVFLLEASWENLFPYLFHLLEAACIPWLIAPSSILKAIKVSSLLPPFYKDPCDDITSTQIIQDHHLKIQNLITPAKSLLNITSLWVLGNHVMDIFGGPYSLCHTGKKTFL